MLSAAKVTNIDAANRQICTSIRLFFLDEDAVSVHTLAAAAREIYEKQCRKLGFHSPFDGCGTVEDEQLVLRRLNHARNFFKHPAQSVHDSIAFGDEANDEQIFLACFDCITLEQQLPEVHAYLMWCLATHDWSNAKFERLHPQDAKAVRALIDGMLALLPGLVHAPRAIKKMWGLKLMQDLIERWGADATSLPVYPMARMRRALSA